MVNFSLSFLCRDNCYTDLTLLVGPQNVPFNIHRIILAGFSDFLDNLFKVNNNETEIHLDIDADIMRMFMKHIYRKQEIEINHDNVKVTFASFFRIIKMYHMIRKLKVGINTFERIHCSHFFYLHLKVLHATYNPIISNKCRVLKSHVRIKRLHFRFKNKICIFLITEWNTVHLTKIITVMMQKYKYHQHIYNIQWLSKYY